MRLIFQRKEIRRTKIVESRVWSVKQGKIPFVLFSFMLTTLSRHLYAICLDISEIFVRVTKKKGEFARRWCRRKDSRKILDLQNCSYTLSNKPR